MSDASVLTIHLFALPSRMAMPHRLRFLFSLALLAATLLPPHAYADDPPQLIELRLLDALIRPDSRGDGRPSVILLLRKTDSGWQRAWGTARDFNHTVHTALLTDAKLTDKTFTLSLDLTVYADARSDMHGFSQFDIKLLRDRDGVYRGKYVGTYSGEQVSGHADATVLPRMDRREDFIVPGGDEHPRILFRKSDLSALREKARTPLGKAAVAKMDGPVGLGVRYQLSGDRKLAEQAMPMVEKLMARGMMSDQYGNNVGDRLEQTALTYDLCYDAWPDDFRSDVEDYLLWAGNGVLDARRDTHQGVNWHVCSNWSAPLYAGAAFAGLALRGKAGEPPAPVPPTMTGSRVAPEKDDFDPPRGVPVQDFETDAMPDDWVYVGGFRSRQLTMAPLLKHNGDSNIRLLVPGDNITFLGDRETVKQLSREKDEGYWANENYDGGKTMIDVTNAVDREYFTSNYFYCVIRNDKPRWVRFVTSSHPGTLLLNGVELQVGEVAHIEAGMYPFLVATHIDQINPWGRDLMRPRLIEISEDEAKRLIAEQTRVHQTLVERQKQRVEEWRALGKIDLRYRDLFERSRHIMYMFSREAVGDGGAQAELTHYSTIAEKPPARYEAAHIQTFGHGVSPQQDIEDLLPRKMMVHVYPDDGDARAQEINGSPSLGNQWFAPLLPTVNERLRPAMLWGWQRHAGFTGDNWEALVGGDAVWALLNYPLDAKAAPPAKTMPLNWRADDFGHYVFRNAWSGGDDFVTQIWAKAHYVGGWNAPNAGTFRVMGLGHVWAWGQTDRNRHRPEESVVQLPDNPDINEGLCGRVTYVKTYKDGSGVVSIDYTDVYATRKETENGRPHRPYERYGHIREDEAFLDSGISGMRSIAVDYSGRSGAPCLIALVDTVRGAESTVWTWQLPRPGRNEDASPVVEQVKTNGRTFTLTHTDGATLHGTFITDHEPVAEVRASSMKGRAGSSKGKELKRPIHAVLADGGEVFFAVVTIGRGDPPKVAWQGEGLDAVAKVGGQRIRFDGKSLIFGESSE